MERRKDKRKKETDKEPIQDENRQPNGTRE
jgi:hypothetical protein